jgi:hypothetical protein
MQFANAAMGLFFPVLVFFPIPLNIVAWRDVVRFAPNSASPQWRKVLAYFGATANSLAIALPWAALIYNIIQPNSTSTDAGLDGFLFMEIAAVLAVVSAIAGALSPRGIRLALIVCNLMWILVVLSFLMIPVGIL